MKTSRVVAVTTILGATVVAAAGCRTSDRTRVHTYDYDDSGAARAHREPVETEREIDSGEWHMVAPGQPVVDPHR